MTEKMNNGQPIDFRTRPEDVPEFLSCGHNAHWVVWHSLAKGEPCILCRAEKAELAVKEMLKVIDESRPPMILQSDIDRWKTVITGDWRKTNCKISLRMLIHIEHELRYAPEFVSLRLQKHITNDQIGEVFRLAMERIEEIRNGP